MNTEQLQELNIPRNVYGSDEGQQWSSNTVNSHANFKALDLDEFKAKYKKWTH